MFSVVRHDINTRYSNYNYVIPRCRTNLGKNSPSYFGITIWAALDNNFKRLPWLEFKRSVLDIVASK